MEMGKDSSFAAMILFETPWFLTNLRQTLLVRWMVLLLVEQVTKVRCVISRIDELTQPLFLRSGSLIWSIPCWNCARGWNGRQEGDNDERCWNMIQHECVVIVDTYLIYFCNFAWIFHGEHFEIVCGGVAAADAKKDDAPKLQDFIIHGRQRFWKKFSKVRRKQRNGTRLCVDTMCIVFFTFLATTLGSHCFHIQIFKLSFSRPWNSNLNCVSVVVFPTGTSPPQGCRIFMGPRSHLKSRHSNEKMQKKAANGWIMPWLWNQFFVCCVFFRKNCKGIFFGVFSWSWNFSAISISLCVWFTSQDWFLSIHNSRQI